MNPRNIRAENEYLRKALALRRRFQEFIDADIPFPERTAEFTMDGVGYYRVTPAQRGILMEMAPEDVRKANE